MLLYAYEHLDAFQLILCRSEGTRFTGMFNTFFELIIHEMPLEEAKHYLEEMRDFYTAGWMKIMGQE